MKCPKCSSRDIDFQESTGQSICVNCGTVLEENTIVSSIEFQVDFSFSCSVSLIATERSWKLTILFVLFQIKQESGDRSHVVGQYISASCSKVSRILRDLFCCRLHLVTAQIDHLIYETNPTSPFNSYSNSSPTVAGVQWADTATLETLATLL